MVNKKEYTPKYNGNSFDPTIRYPLPTNNYIEARKACDMAPSCGGVQFITNKHKGGAITTDYKLFVGHTLHKNDNHNPKYSVYKKENWESCNKWFLRILFKRRK